MNALADHLWQSLQVIACLAAFGWLTRRHAAAFRLWLWRVAAMKLVVPLQWLSAVGGWFGFPVSHSAEPAPAALSRWVRAFDDWMSPIGPFPIGMRWTTWIALVGGTIAAAWYLRRVWRRDAVLADGERRRLERDPDDRPLGIGLAASVLMSAWALVILGAPMLSGSLAELERRQVLLHANEASLRDAPVVIRPAAPGMGARLRVTADERGVTIRNATLQEIGGLAYGVSVYLVRGQHFTSGGEDWLIGERHDVRVSGAVLAPGEFDAYALRRPLTQALAREYGIEIYHNGTCQPPCGRWGAYVLPAAARAAEAVAAPR